MTWLENPKQLTDGYYWHKWLDGDYSRELIELVKVKDNLVYSFVFPCDDGDGDDLGQFAGAFMGPILFPLGYSMDENTAPNAW